MNRWRDLFVMLAVMLIVPVSFVSAQLPMAQSPIGTEYYVAFPQNGDIPRKANPRFLGVVITSQVPTTGTIEVPVGTTDWETKRFSTQPGQATMIELSGGLEQQTSEEIGRGGVHIVSRDPVSVSVLNSRYLSGSGYAALPINFWRNKYLPLAFPYADGERNSQVMIVAAYDNTLVKIKPSSRLYTKQAGEEILISLKRGETYMFQAYKHPLQNYVADLSGTEIQSLNYPIGVISGHVRTPVTLSGSYSILQDYAAPQASMILPDSAWGTEYYSVPFRPEGDRFRVIGAYYNTTITITFYKPDGSFDRTENVVLNRGEIYDTKDYGLAVTGPVHWSATRPVMIVQYRTSRSYSDPLSNSPMALPLTAVRDFASRTLAAAPEEIRGGKLSHVMTLIVKSADGADPFGSVLVGGQPIAQALGTLNVRRIGSTNYYYVANIALPAGGHIITAEKNHLVAGVVYSGSAAGDGYAWALPSWMPQVGPDVDPPYVKSLDPNASKGVVSIDISDRTSVYFSGINDIQSIDSPGWERVQYNGPLTIDDDASVTFRAKSDPSGPLTVRLCDNAGNCKTVEYPGVCFKTATVDQNIVALSTTLGREISKEIALNTNACGDRASITSMSLDNSDAYPYLEAKFSDGSIPPLQMEPGSKRIVMTLKANAPIVDSYRTNLRLQADDSTIVIAVTVTVNGPSGVNDISDATSLAVMMYPNPFTSVASISLNRPLGLHARVTIADAVGRIVREFDGTDLAGRSRVEWNGSNADGAALPAGVYLVTILDGATRIVRGLTLLR